MKIVAVTGGAQCLFVRTDIGVPSQIARWVAHTVHRLGCPDALVNNAGIRVNCVSPGRIETRDWKYTPRAVKPRHSRKDLAQHPVGRVGRPEDIADACFYLVEQAGFMTGQNLTLDGGMTVRMIYEA